MQFNFQSFTACAALLLGATVCLADKAPQLDYAGQLEPILSKNCVACHNAKKSEGGLNLESHAQLMLGGDSGLAVDASAPQESQLLLRIASVDDPMPPEDNAVGAKRLTTDEIELFRQWIAAGALAPEVASMQQLQWQPIPEGLQPIYAMAASPDGNYLSYGRGSLVGVTTQNANAAQQRTQILVDPELSLPGPGSPAGMPAAQHSPTTHLDIVQSLAFSPDSQRLATGGFRNVKIWRRSNAPTRQLAGLSIPDGVSAISSDGRWIAQSSAKQAMEITDCQTRQSHRFLESHTAQIVALAWLASPPVLLSCDADGKMALTDPRTNHVAQLALAAPVVAKTLRAISDSKVLAIDLQAQLHELNISPGDANQSPTLSTREIPGWQSVVDLAVSAVEPRQAAIATGDGKLKLVALADMQILREIDAQHVLQSVSISRDGKWIAAVPATGAAQVWKAEDGSLAAKLDSDYSQLQMLRVSQRDVARQTSLVERLNAKIPELQKAAEQEAEASKKVQEARDKAAEALAAKVSEIAASAARVEEAQKALSDAQAAAAQAMQLVETKMSEVDASQKAALETEQQKQAAEDELAKREQALTSAQDSTARAAAKLPQFEQRINGEKSVLEELQMKLTNVQGEDIATDSPKALAFTADGGRIVVAHHDQRLRVFSASDGVPESNQPTAATTEALLVTAENELVCLESNGSVQAWDLDFPWVLERSLGSVAETRFSDRISSLDFSPDGSWLAIGSGPPSRSGDVTLVDANSGEVVLALPEAHSDSVLSLKFSPDGRKLATAGADKICRIWQIPSGEHLAALEGHTHHILGVAWKDDGLTLITAGADASLKVWDVENATQLRTISGFTKEISAVSFVGQSSEFVLAANDGSARLYNADDGKQIRAYAGASHALYALAISAEYKMLYSGGQAGQIWIWKLDDAQLVKTLP